ncbi:MAG: hypothetical protein LBS43_12520 [Prevotellaceae bacterium]|jgi:hypothetical protein|nr:hypothetical protein [Prevotellaceae bacterium]
MMIKDIVHKIDEAIKNRMLTFSCLAGAKFFGVAEPIVRLVDEGEEWFPVVIDNDGEDRYVFIDDDYPLGIYHHIIGKTYIPAVKNSYGDSQAFTVQADMKLICWGLRNQVRTTADRIESFIYASLPEVAVPVRSSFDRSLVFSNEFRGVQFFLPEVAFLFSVDYYLKYTPARRACIDLSDLCVE